MKFKLELNCNRFPEPEMDGDYRQAPDFCELNICHKDIKDGPWCVSIDDSITHNYQSQRTLRLMAELFKLAADYVEQLNEKKIR